MLGFLLFSSAFCANLKYASCRGTGSNVEIIDNIDNSYAAWATWDDALNENGTTHIIIETSKLESFSSSEKLYCAGYVDGYLMSERIWNRWMLQKDILNITREENFPDTWTSWLQENIDYTRNQVKQNVNDSYWISVGLILNQFDGLHDGYNKAASSDRQMSEMDFWILQSVGDIYDLELLWNKEKADPLHFMECSGLVRLLDDYSDIYFSHDTWSDYRKMSNTVKEYNFDIPQWTAHRMIVTTKIGAIPSSEDFWITDNGLLILETTFNNKNTTLQLEVKDSKTKLLTWIRNYHASWIANSGEEWADAFLRENSGTYNNQYVIVDAKVLVPKQKPTKDLIWITETMPKMERKLDVTDVLVNDGYFPSINVPYIRDIYEIANYSIDQDGNMVDYYNANRFKIFQRDAKNVTTFEDFQKLMRQNKGTKEPFGNNPSDQIFSRYDLNEANPKAFGGLDTKATTALSVLNNLSFHGIWSPLYQPEVDPLFIPWDFESELNVGKFGKENLKHDGLPAKWEFDWMEFKADKYSRCNVTTDKDVCIEIPLCGWCTYDAVCVLGYSDGPAPGYKCQAGWRFKSVDKPWSTPVIISITVASFLFCGVIFGYNLYSHLKKKEAQKQYSQII